MFREFAPALIFSVAVHLAAAGGYWLWGGAPAGSERAAVVEVALLVETAPATPVPEREPEARVERLPEPPPVPLAPARPEPAPVAAAPVSKPQPHPVEAAPVPPPVAANAAAMPGPSAPPQPDPGLLASIEAAYKAELQAEIARHRSYPGIARRLRQEGTARIGFVLQADGRITAVSLVESSGYGLLDEAALAAVREVQRFRPIPPELARGQWNLTVPLNFRLL